MATYFDPNRNSKIDYKNIKKVLDDVLLGYAKSGGTFIRAVRKYGKHVFSHNTTFCCVKQLPRRSEGCLLCPPSHAGDRKGPSSPSATI